MDALREFCGYLLGFAFCLAALALCGVAWIGLENQFGWQYSLIGIVACLAIRINFPLLVGLFFYATNVMAWGQLEAVAFASPGLLLLVPSIAAEIFSILLGVTARR